MIRNEEVAGSVMRLKKSIADSDQAAGLNEVFLLVELVLSDLHRIANALETLAEAPNKVG